VQQEKEMVENQLHALKEDMLDGQEASENRISQLEDELRLSMDHVTNAIKERDRTNAEITSVLREKADMAAREVLLTQRIQELQMEVEKANNESKVKSELEIVKLQRDSLFEIIKQQEQALHMQQQQSEASLKMLHQRQAALDRYEQRSEGEHDELSDLQKNLQSLLANEGQTLYSELIDAKKLIAVIASVREKVLESGLLKEDIARLQSERDAQRSRIERMEKEATAWRAEKSEVVDQLEHFKKHAIDWETRAQYWQQVAKKTSAHTSSSLNDSHDHALSGFASSTITKSAEYLDLRSENVALQERLARTQEQLQEKQRELAEAKGDMEKEFSQLWTSVEQLNKLDASKDKTIAELKAERDAAAREKNEYIKKFRVMEQEYEGLQSELQVRCKVKWSDVYK
jgi:chromosome segregation ATPase